MAILITTLVAEKRIKLDKQNNELFWGFVIAVIVGGLIGARLYHVSSEWNYYASNPIRILEIYNGGMALIGGIIGGVFSAYFYTKKHKLSLIYYLSVTSSVLPLAQSIGRWANYINHELYGLPTTLPWAIYIPNQFRINGYENYETYHPLFLYESILDFLLFIYLQKQIHKVNLNNENKRMSIIGKYLVGYGIIRFSLEFLRINAWNIYGFNVAQILALIMIIIGFRIQWKAKV